MEHYRALASAASGEARKKKFTTETRRSTEVHGEKEIKEREGQATDFTDDTDQANEFLSE